MRAIAWLLILALAWTAVSGSFSGEQFLAGIILGIVVLAAIRPTGVDPVRRIRRVAFFAVFFVVELVLANLRIARDVLSPRPNISPGVVAIPLDLDTDVQITALANFITLTPGTLALDVSHDRTVLYVHGMYVADADELIRDTKEGFERRIKELWL